MFPIDWCQDSKFNPCIIKLEQFLWVYTHLTINQARIWGAKFFDFRSSTQIELGSGQANDVRMAIQFFQDLHLNSSNFHRTQERA